jgi:PAS domain S-box-containing protein
LPARRGRGRRNASARIAARAAQWRAMQAASRLMVPPQRQGDDAESRLARRAHQQAEVAALGIEALRQTDLDAFLAEAARRLSAALDVDLGSVFELVAGGEALRLRAGAGWSADAIGRLTVPTGPRSHAGYTLSVGEPVVVADYATDPRFQPPAFVRELGVISGVAVVIHGPAEPFGVVAVGSLKRRLFSQDDVSFLQAAANVVSTAIARQLAEQALRESERRFRAFAETASDFLWEQDGGRRFTFLSREEPQLGLRVGTAIDDFLPRAVDPDSLREHIEDLRRQRPFRDYVCSFFGADQRIHHIRMSGRPVHDANGAFVGYRGSCSEITNQIEAAERLRQAQKMEAVGQLTGGIAHDFNNLLLVVIGCTEMLLDHLDPQDALGRTLASQLAQAGARGADLTGRLLAFSRRQPLNPRIVRLNELVLSLVPLLRRTLGENVEIRTSLPEGVGNTMADASQVENALLNLAVNARDAMPGGGQLLIETKNVVFDEDYAASVGDLRPGRYVMLAVTDTGCGMPPEVRQRAFEPFFTTKEKGKGTGLGLAMIYGFAKQSDGHAAIYSEVGRGTTVRLYLPRSDMDAVEAAAPAGSSLMHGDGETVLLVEDDREVRAMLALRLAALGYDVVEAVHGRAALDVVRQGVAFDLVLTDVVMPSGVDGWDLAEAVWQERPGVPVVFMTGYTDNVVLRQARQDQAIRVLSKPFRQRDLAAALYEALHLGEV